jgi:membrane fusion protein, multidrug efflux system
LKFQIFNKKYRILYATLAIIILLGGIKFFQIYSIIQASKGRGAPPATVNTFIVKQENWPETFSGIGSLRAVQGSILRTQDSGRVASVNFESGQTVEQGQVLLELDSEVEKAQLQAAQAQYKLSELTANRQRELRAQNANSQADLDIANADLSLARAEVARLEAVIQRRQIVAPFAGVAGVRKLNVGEFVTSGTEVVDVNSSEKFLLDFYLPQKNIGQYKVGDIVEIAVRNIQIGLRIGILCT